MTTHILAYKTSDGKQWFEQCTSIEQARLVEAEYRETGVCSAYVAHIFELVESINE